MQGRFPQCCEPLLQPGAIARHRRPQSRHGRAAVLRLDCWTSWRGSPNGRRYRSELRPRLGHREPASPVLAARRPRRTRPRSRERTAPRSDGPAGSRLRGTRTEFGGALLSKAFVTAMAADASVIDMSGGDSQWARLRRGGPENVLADRRAVVRGDAVLGSACGGCGSAHLWGEVQRLICSVSRSLRLA